MRRPPPVRQRGGAAPLHRGAADGRRLWVTHGDLCDGVILYAKWLAYLGDTLYELALRANRHLNSWRARWGLPYWSLSQYRKHRVKSVASFITRFEQALAAEAQRRGLDGVISCHSHRPELRQIGEVLCCNDGNWVESLSALVEHADGRLEIVNRAQVYPLPFPPTPPPPSPAEALAVVRRVIDSDHVANRPPVDPPRVSRPRPKHPGI